MTETLTIRSANPTDADELLAIRRDAIMALAEEYGRVAAERWATAAPPDRAAKAIATNSVWITELGSKVVGWVEVSGATIESLYVSPASARRGVGSSLLTHAERQIRDAGAPIAHLDASPNAEAFYARHGYRRAGEVKANNSIPMSKRLDLSAVEPALEGRESSMSATIRAGVLGDEELLAVLNGVVHELHVAHRPESFKPTRPENVSAWFRSLLQKPTVLIWIAEQDGVPVGYVLALLHDRAEDPFCPARRWCEIDQIAVDEKWRRRGVARALVQRVLAEVRGRGIRDVEMSSWSFNETAHHAFRRLGFAPKVIRFGLTLPG